MKLKCKDRCFYFRKPIEIKISFANGLWTHESKALSATGYGLTCAESYEGYKEDFTACWDHIATEHDEKLTKDAQELKQKLRDIVESVEEIPRPYQQFP